MELKASVQGSTGLLGRGHVLLLFLVSGLGVLAGGLVGPALPGMGAHFGRGVNDLELRLVLTTPALFMAIAAASSPFLRSHISQRTVLVAALLVYGASGAAGAVASSLVLLLVLRALQGLATGLLMTTVITIIADMFEGERRTDLLAQQSAFMSASSIVVALIAGLLAALDWRATFLTYGLAFLLVRPAIGMPSLPSSSRPKGSHLVRQEKWVIAILSIAAFFGMLGFYLLPMLVPFLLPKIGYASPIAAGGALALAMATSAAGSLAYRAMRRSAGASALLTIALAMMAVSVGAIGQAETLVWLMLWMALFGTGMGILLPNLSDTAAMRIHPDSRHVAIGAITMGLFMGQFASSLASKPALDAGGLGLAFGTAALLLAVATAILPLGLVVTRTRPLPAPDS